jgi:hypothetical protein
MQWGKPGQGRGVSGGEEIDLVPGIAGGHVYTVLDAYSADGKLWVKVQNPWHNFGRVYEADGKNLKPRKDPLRGPEKGSFALELGDLMRYYGAVWSVE